jgi:hypothetical protein
MPLFPAGEREIGRSPVPFSSDQGSFARTRPRPLRARDLKPIDTRFERLLS